MESWTCSCHTSYLPLFPGLLRTSDELNTRLISAFHEEKDQAKTHGENLACSPGGTDRTDANRRLLDADDHAHQPHEIGPRGCAQEAREGTAISSEEGKDSSRTAAEATPQALKTRVSRGGRPSHVDDPVGCIPAAFVAIRSPAASPRNTLTWSELTGSMVTSRASYRPAAFWT